MSKWALPGRKGSVHPPTKIFWQIFYSMMCIQILFAIFIIIGDGEAYLCNLHCYRNLFKGSYSLLSGILWVWCLSGFQPGRNERGARILPKTIFLPIPIFFGGCLIGAPYFTLHHKTLISGVVHRSLKNNVSINFNINVYGKILF